MQSIAISEFKATCLKLLDQLSKTRKSLIITKKGHPVAMVVPPPPEKKHSLFGSLKNEITIKGDIVSPLGNTDWEVFKK